MFLARFLRAIRNRPVPMRGRAPQIDIPCDVPKTGVPISVTGPGYNKRERALTVKLDLDTSDAKAKVQELIDMANEAQAILAKVNRS